MGDSYYVRIPRIRQPDPTGAPDPLEAGYAPAQAPAAPSAPPGADPLDAGMPLAPTSPGDGPPATDPSPVRAFGVVPLHVGSGKHLAMLRAIMLALGGFAAGLVVIGLAWFLQLLFLFLSGPFSRREWTSIFAIAALCAIGGIVMGVTYYLPWRKRSALSFAGDRLVMNYPAFSGHLEIPRALIRVVTFDDRPVVRFRNNRRFPVTGVVPGEMFKDALDNFPRPPWEPFGDNMPVLAGMDPEKDPHLFSGDGTALPVLRLSPEDVPNTAIIFHEPVRLPRVHPSQAIACQAGTVYVGSRTVKGIMIRLADAAAAERLAKGWGVVRQVSVDDVLDEGLFLPKPLRGWRMAAFAGLMVAFVVVREITKRLG